MDFKHNSLFTFDNKEIEGDEIGIFWYGFMWVTFVLLFAFSNEKVINEIMKFYIYFDIVALIFIIIFVSFLRKTHSENQRSFLEFKSFNRRDFGNAICFSVIFFVLLLIINFLLNLVIVPGKLEFLEYNAFTYLFLQLSRTIIVEELVFRGALFSFLYFFFTAFLKLTEKRSIILSIIISSVLFGAYHYFAYSDQYFSVLYPIIYLSFLGLFCAILKVQYGLWAAILLHTINNVIAFFSGNLVGLEIQLSFNITNIITILVFIFIFILVFSYLKRINTLSYPYFIISFISFFIVGTFINGIINLESIGLYFEQFHLIFLLPFFYEFLKKKVKLEKLHVLISGAFIGLILSDMPDLIRLNLLKIVCSVLYFLFFLYIFSYYKLTTSFLWEVKNNDN